MLNVVILEGRLTAKPEGRKTQNGDPATLWTIAVNRDLKDQPCDFVDCVAFGKLASIIYNNCDKGTKIIVHGRMMVRDYTNKDGNKVRKTDVIVDRFYFSDVRQVEQCDNDVIPF